MGDQVDLNVFKICFIIIIEEYFLSLEIMDSGEVIFAKVTDVIGKTGMYQTNHFRKQGTDSAQMPTCYHAIPSFKKCIEWYIKAFLGSTYVDD